MPNRKRPHFLGVWLSDAAKTALDEHVAAAGTTRSEVVWRMLAYAVWKMPKGWKPPSPSATPPDVDPPRAKR